MSSPLYMSPQVPWKALRLVILLPFLLTPSHFSCAQTFTVLYNFTGIGRDGGMPSAGVVLDSQGNVYGTTTFGGRWAFGTAYKVTPSGVETILHQFNSWDLIGAGLLLDAKGNLYGAAGGWAPSHGVVYELDPNRHFKVLHRFKGTDGAEAYAPLIMDSEGSLYGTTFYGGDYNVGTVFMLTPTHKLKVLYSFTGGTDGTEPDAALVFDAQGNLYGTTVYGGGEPNCGLGCGTVFKVTPNGLETVLYRFTGASDGSTPGGGLVLDGQGNLYGTTEYGGDLFCGSGRGCGTVFKVTPSGTETVLYSFTGGADGFRPVAGVVFDSQGNLYGTTLYGGTSTHCSGGCGTVFRLAPTGTETVLYSFCSQGACADGSTPESPLVLDAQGNLYGTTWAGGLNQRNCASQSCGVVFKLTP